MKMGKNKKPTHNRTLNFRNEEQSNEQEKKKKTQTHKQLHYSWLGQTFCGGKKKNVQTREKKKRRKWIMIRTATVAKKKRNSR